MSNEAHMAAGAQKTRKTRVLTLAWLAGAILLTMGAPRVGAELPYTVELRQDSAGWQLLVDSEPFPIQGVVWSFAPIGSNFNYNLWDQPEDVIRNTIDTDARLLADMGVNAIRSFTIIPPRWVTYLYTRYDIYTIVNYTFARYGISVNGKWYPNTPYDEEPIREKILVEARETIETFKDTPGVLMFLYGNENNYGLQWSSNAIENLPVGQRLETRARFLYSLFEEAIVAGKELTSLPVGIVNGDTQYLNVIAEETPSLDVFGTNVYRGERSGDLFFQSVATLLDKPIVYTEFGADAFNVRTGLEDQYNQALYLRSQWQEIYEQAYGKGKTGNMLGGFIFEWMDEWWKHGLDVGLYEHNTVGTWRNAAYYDGGTRINNMNEEWFGIVGQSEQTRDGINVRLPRAAYYMMADVWTRGLYDIPAREVAGHFDALLLEQYMVRGEARAVQNQLADIVDVEGTVSVNVRGHFNEDIENIEGNAYDALNFSHAEVTTLTLTVTPLENLALKTTLRAQLGELNQYDALTDSYEFLISREQDDDELSYISDDLTSSPRVPIEFYSGAFKFESEALDINGYYHDGIDNPGHADYYLQGDFFYLYPETFDLVGMDLGLSKAPFGVEFTTKGAIEGFTVFAGPEIFWGSEPAIYAKFYRELFENFYLGVVHYEAFQEEQFNSAQTITPLRLPNRKSSLYLQYGVPAGPVDLQLGVGALMAGTEFLTAGTESQQTYRSADGTTKQLGFADTLGGKARIEALFDLPVVFQLYTEYVYAGLAASARPFLARAGTQIVDSGAANRHEVVAGGNLWVGDFIISPKFRWRTPIDPAITTGTMRNAVTQPVYVHGGNREIVQAEIVLTYDQTGATWFHEWNNSDREDAVIAASLGFLWTIMQGATDPLPELFLSNGTYSWNSWPEGMAAQTNLWSLQARFVSNFAPRHKIVVTFNTGYGQNIGRPDTEPGMHYDGTIDLQLNKLEIGLGLAHNAFGPEDWHFNQNIRAPWSWDALIAYHLGIFSFIEAPVKDRIGLQYRGRWLEFEGSTPESRDALNTLGDPSDRYRMEVTLFYELAY